MRIETNKHERQNMWCDGCKKACIEPLDDYTQTTNGNFCQECEPIVKNTGALR